MPTGNEEDPQFYGQGMVEDFQNGLCTKSLQRQIILSAWIPGLLTLKIQGSVPPYLDNPQQDCKKRACLCIHNPFHNPGGPRIVKRVDCLGECYVTCIGRER